MAAGVDIRVVHTAVGTTGATQDITVSGFGTPKGALFFWGEATADGTTPIDDAHIGMGATDFTREWACSYFSEHNTDPSQATHMGSTTKCIQFSNNTGTGVETNMEADASTITDGLRLTWAGTPGAARRFTVIMFTGDDCHVEAGTFLNDSQLVNSARVITLTDMTVRPEVVFIGHPKANAFSSTVTADAACSFGFGADHSGTIDQSHKSWTDQDARNPANRHGENVDATHIASTPPFTGSTLITAWELTLTSVNGTPRGVFHLTKRITSATSSFGYFCYSSDGNNGYDVDQPGLLHTTGAKSYTAPGFQPQFALLFPSQVSNAGVSTSGNAAGIGVSAIDEDTLTEGCLHTQSDETDPSDSSSAFASDFFSIFNDTGALSYAGDFDAFTSTGFDYTPSTTANNAKPTPVLCIEETVTGQSVTVPAIAAKAIIVGLDRTDQSVPATQLPPIAAAAAILAPTVRFPQSVAVPAVPAATVVVAPDRVDQTAPVPAEAAATAVLAPDRIDQTLAVDTIAAATAIPTPTVLGDQLVSVPAVGATAVIVAPTRVDQTLAVAAATASTVIPTPIINKPVDVPAVAASTAVLAPARVDQTVNVSPVATAAVIPAPTVLGDQLISVPAVAAGTSVLAPARVDQTVAVPAVAAPTAVLAPVINKPVNVPAVAAGTAVLAPARVDQTLNVTAVAAATAIPAPAIDVSADQNVSVPAVAASAVVVAPDRVDQTADVGAVPAAAVVVAPDRVDQTADVGAVPVAAVIVAPDRVDQTVNAPSIPAGTDVPAPTVTADQVVAIPAVAAGTAIPAPIVDAGVVGPAIVSRDLQITTPTADLEITSEGGDLIV
jgi:hypothetical protein